MLNKPELAHVERFLTNEARVSARDELIPLLDEAFVSKSRDEWWEELGGHGFPCGPVRSVKESFECEQAVHRGMALEFEHSVAGRVTVPAHPIKYSKSPVSDGRSAKLLPPPMLGEHTEETLTNLLGMTPSEVETLEDDGIVSCWRGVDQSTCNDAQRRRNRWRGGSKGSAEAA
mmetsp:Transcript_1896/g.4097  ORF Transcript_1896/g.4097 Transcript_1896/m.4097 type:complete len:174 (-) Transcript_1896:2678-3199(-)